MEIVRGHPPTVMDRVGSIPTVAVAGLALAVWTVSGLYMLHFGSGWHLDLRVYRAAGHELFAGGDPLVGLFTVSKLPFTYPPFALLVLSPLAFGPLGLIEALWWLTSSAALVASLFVVLEAERGVHQVRGDGAGERRRQLRSLAAAAVLGAVASLALEPVRSNLDYGQINLFLMLLIVVDLTRADSRWRGVMTGMSAAIKLTPLLYLGYFLLRRSQTAFLRGVATFVVASALAWLVLPAASARYWLHEVADPKRTGDVGGVSNQSFEGLLNRAPFHGGAVAAALWPVLCVVTIACGVVLVRRLRVAPHPAETIMALALVELLVSPISWTHHWSWLAIAPVAVVSLWRRHRVVAWLLAALVALAVIAPYWWVADGPFTDLASNSLVIAGAVTLLAWTIAELRGAVLTRSPSVAAPGAPR